MSRHLLADVTANYQESKRRHEQYSQRGDEKSRALADAFLDEMKAIERCVTITEHNTGWRKLIEERRKAEQARAQR